MSSHSVGVRALSSWVLSHGSKTTPVSTNERDTRNENFHRSKTMVAQSHVGQADDALVAVSNGRHYAKAWCAQVHPTWNPGGALCRECRGSSKKVRKSFVRGDMAMTRSHGKNADHGHVGVEQCERPQRSSPLCIGSSRVQRHFRALCLHLD